MCNQLLDEILPLWGACEYEGNCYIAAAFPYRLPEEYYVGRNISRYAVVRDYHAICGARLERACDVLHKFYPGKAFEWRCDNSSLPEVALAERAGLGYRGRHNLLITPEYGSWVFLGVIMSEVWLEAKSRQAANCCGTCPGHCAKACPTGALSENGFEKSRCVSFISQGKGERLPEEAQLLRQAGTVWGCDLCQEACPQNRQSKVSPLPEFLVEPIAYITKETPVEGRAYAWRGKTVLHRNLKFAEGAL